MKLFNKELNMRIIKEIISRIKQLFCQHKSRSRFYTEEYEFDGNSTNKPISFDCCDGCHSIMDISIHRTRKAKIK